MPPIDSSNLELLKTVLMRDYVIHLPLIINTNIPEEQKKTKNICRALSAFTLKNLCELKISDACKAVVDDYNDGGIDAIYYNAKNETLYFVQSKLKATEEFKQNEALSYCNVLQKILNQNYDGLNQNIIDRKVELNGAVENCKHIQIVIAHVGSGISVHASNVLNEFIQNKDFDPRLPDEIENFDSQKIIAALHQIHAYPKIKADLYIDKCQHVSTPKEAYFGLIRLKDLVDLHNEHGKILYEKNIRTFLGNKTHVNESIKKTLESEPENFLFLNNGVTALSHQIDVRGPSSNRLKKIKVWGFSIINGAQTIATAAEFLKDNNNKDISKANVSFTIIKSHFDDNFGKKITEARNHQNQVRLTNFAALDDVQERLRRDLAHLEIEYFYKDGVTETPTSLNQKQIFIEEATRALAIFDYDPKMIVVIKKEPSELLKVDLGYYPKIFTSDRTAYQLANAVYFYRYIQERIQQEIYGADGQEKLTYKHGVFVIAWVLSKQIYQEMMNSRLFSIDKLNVKLSIPFDSVRNLLWDKTKAELSFKGPLALFRNNSDVQRIINKMCVEHFQLGTDPAIPHKSGVDLFKYMSSKAPQITGLS